MPESVSTRPAYKILTCIYLCRTLLFFAPYADFFIIKLLCFPIPRQKRIKNKVWELYLLYPFSLASRIAYGTDKTIATHTNFDNI